MWRITEAWADEVNIQPGKPNVWDLGGVDSSPRPLSLGGALGMEIISWLKYEFMNHKI